MQELAGLKNLKSLSLVATREYAAEEGIELVNKLPALENILSLNFDAETANVILYSLNPRAQTFCLSRGEVSYCTK